MTTTLNQIRSHHPCKNGWNKLLKHLNKTTADDEPLPLLTVLDSNGIADAVWCLRTERTPERSQRFALAVARRVEHLHPAAKACNDVTERYLNGAATKAELDAASRAAYAVVAYASYGVVAAARAAAYAAYAAAADATADAAADAAIYAAARAANAAAYTAEREAQAQIFKEIFA